MKHKPISVFLTTLLIISIFSLTSCKSIRSIFEVHLTFIQHSNVTHAFDVNHNLCGYYFKNDEIARTEFVYKKGYYLSKENIDWFFSNVKYHMPPLNGDGYCDFTAFTTDFDEETGLSTQFLKPCKLTKDLTIHFGLWG